MSAVVEGGDCPRVIVRGGGDDKIDWGETVVDSGCSGGGGSMVNDGCGRGGVIGGSGGSSRVRALARAWVLSETIWTLRGAGVEKFVPAQYPCKSENLRSEQG